MRLFILVFLFAFVACRIEPQINIVIPREVALSFTGETTLEGYLFTPEDKFSCTELADFTSQWPTKSKKFDQLAKRRFTDKADKTNLGGSVDLEMSGLATQFPYTLIVIACDHSTQVVHAHGCKEDIRLTRGQFIDVNVCLKTTKSKLTNNACS